MMNVTNSQLDNRFRCHKPTPDALQAHAKVTELTLALAKELRDILPDGRNAALALTHLEDVRMRANAAIACDSTPAALGS